jgi:hypothetical protein
VMTIKIRKAPQQVTTGVVTVARVWSGMGATKFTGSTAGAGAFQPNPANRYANPMKHSTDLTPVLGTRAWSPPV